MRDMQPRAGDSSWLPFLLQTSDASFPTGAYAHSLGFEESVRLGVVRDEASLCEFLLTQIVPAQSAHELPYLRFAHDAAVRGDLKELCWIDQEISAWKLARETREASAQLGVRRLKALRAIGSNPLLAGFASEIESCRARGHHLVVCGIQAASENVPLEPALQASLYQALAGVCAAALKLIRIGQDGCQRVLRTGCREAAETIARSLTVSREHAGWFNPLLEIASMRHERAEERLFIS